MTTVLDSITRPGAGVDHRSRSRHRTVGFVLAAVGLLLAVVALIANIAAATGTEQTAGQTLAWSFGLSTTAFAMIKLGIGVILVGILVRLWLRIDSVRTALPHLKANATARIQPGAISTAFGPAAASDAAPGALPIHRMARTMWAPMLLMGFMAVAVGLVVSFAWAGSPGDTALAAWTQGLQFLGEGMLLAGIAFLLGSILGSLREGGGRVQEALGVTVKTLDMPTTAKAFVALMALGVTTSMVQFVLYLVVAAGVTTPAAWFAWLGPIREIGLGLILGGIVFALVTIGNVLGFQFARIRDIVATGQ